MPEEIFGASPVEALLLIVGLLVIYYVVYRVAAQATDIVMGLVPWILGGLLLLVALFVGLMTVRGIQWSLMQ